MLRHPVPSSIQIQFIMSDFSELKLDFSQSDHASVFYAHLQNIFLELKVKSEQALLMDKLDKVLLDIYKEHYKLQKQHLEVTLSLKNMLTQCNQIIKECHSDREQLSKVTQDRQTLMKKLQAQTDDSLTYLTELEKLRATMSVMQELNGLLVQKNQFLQQQVESQTVSIENGKRFTQLKGEYDSIISDNRGIQADLSEIVEKTKIMDEMSMPLQILGLAFKSNPALKEEIWKEVSKNREGNHLQNEKQIGEAFLSLDFLEALSKMK